MNRRKTVFLCTASSFWTGLGSVLNIGGNLYDYNRSEDADRVAIANDWLMVGQDIRDAMDKVRTELVAGASR